MLSRKGLLFIISSPSGAGKTTLSKSLREKFPNLRFSVSCTTRPRRAAERDGLDYHFVSIDMFDDMVKKNLFAEWAIVHGNRYGTTKESVRMALDLGQDVLFDVDYQGAESLHAQFPTESKLIYILPPSLKVLATRLLARGTETKELVVQRLTKAKEELSHYASYQYLVVNDSMEKAMEELSAIYEFEHLKQMSDSKHFTQQPSSFRIALACTLSQRIAQVEALLREPLLIP